MIKGIIFDCFGVLVGTGFSDTYRQAGGDPVKDHTFIWDTLNASNIGAITEEDMSKMMAEKIGITVEQWRKAVDQAEQPNKPIFEYIKELKNTYKTSILSNVNKGTLERKILPEQMKLFDVVIGSAEVGMVKPNADIYHYAAEQLGLEPSECVFTDDIQAYCDGATAVGMHAILYTDFEEVKQQLEKILAADSND